MILRLLLLTSILLGIPHGTSRAAESPAPAPPSLLGKVLCGYQGWFNCPGDGADRGWVHWSRRGSSFGPGTATVDLWPDVSELGPTERFATGFTNAAGKPAEVFSSFHPDTVRRHFAWMQQYGIDGIFLQRFAVGLREPKSLRQNNTVLEHCRKGARETQRAFAVMYDLSGMGSNSLALVREDWRTLRSQFRVTEDRQYLQHRGKPLVAVWGIGFNDGRKYSLAECRELVEFLRADGCAVMVGVPTFWRELKRDALADPALLDLIRRADVVSPWTVGRYRTVPEVARHAEQVLKPDLAWCAEAKVDYLPVVFPGFSWHNLTGGPLNVIPRQRGEFLWSQFVEAKRAGSQMVYVAMFDEVDEATAIFKCTNEVPVGEGVQFLTYEGLPSDFYLRVTGAGTRMIHGTAPLQERLPVLP